MESISLPTFSGWTSVQFKDIIRLEGAGNYTIFVLIDGQRLIYSKTISYFEQLVPHTFVRISKSCIANLSYLSDCWESHEKEFSMSDGHRILIARRRRYHVIERVSEWLLFVR